MDNNEFNKEEGDPEYGKAFSEGLDAYNCGKALNAYPKSNLETDTWDKSKKYLGWNDGYHHGPYSGPPDNL
ncbi:MAG: hypothetical protein HRT95_00530 [Moritella sp.]|uniref:hypothetical protein n=1 Tax=Moritella sp. TaxID=78556 RepID=UPI001DEAECDC|nr:hypothetical protein [Moritella sp.]NQZ48703.1 hypothetical protein [Moritella sp.]